MPNRSLLALEAAHRCREALLQLVELSYKEDHLVERALDMCEEINRYFDRWPVTRLHRWLGFIFGIMAAREVMTPGE